MNKFKKVVFLLKLGKVQRGKLHCYLGKITNLKKNIFWGVLLYRYYPLDKEWILFVFYNNVIKN